MLPLVEPIVDASVHLAERWARVVEDRDAALLEQLVGPLPGPRQTCLEHLIDTTGEARRAALDFARAHADINLRALVAALDDPAAADERLSMQQGPGDAGLSLAEDG